jgi:hypothetical protein
MEENPPIKKSPMQVIGEENLTAKKPFDPKAIRARIYAEHYERYFKPPPMMVTQS